MKKIAFIPARFANQSLPSGVFSEIDGKPMLAHVLQRVRSCRSLDEVVVVTSIKPIDQPIDEFCKNNGWSCFRGAEADLLDRLYQAASHYDADIVVRIEADCPLIDPFWIDAVVDRVCLSSGKVDYVSNFYGDRKLPRGLEVEAITLPVLRKIWANFSLPQYRQNPLLGLYENSQQFNMSSVHHCEDFTQHDWKVETEDDLKLIREIYSVFSASKFSWVDVLAQHQAHPEWQVQADFASRKNVA